VLSVEEVARVLGCVHQPRYREFEFFVISKQPVQLPRWIRMGKWASKILVEAAAPLQAAEYTGSFTCTAPLNPLDVPGRLQTFDLISMPPVSLLVNARIEGPYYELPDGVKVPAGMRYTFPK
jgi:CRISPR-associated protein Csc1